MKMGLIFALLLVAMSAAFATIDTAAIRITLSRFEPYPAEPGAYMTVWIKVDNIGRSEARNFEMELAPEFPFSLDPNEESSREIYNIPAGGSVVVNYRIRVDENAVGGENRLNLRYRHSGFNWLEMIYKIQVQTHESILQLKNFYSEQISPGGTGELIMTLENRADNFLKDISITLNLEDVPFSPFGGGTIQREYLIEPKSEKNVTFGLMAFPDADGGIYRIPANIKYSDSVGDVFSRDDYVTLIVGSEPDLIVKPIGDAYLVSGRTGRIALNVINTGLTRIRFLRISIAEGKDYSIVPPSEEYIGYLNSDDFQSVDFRILPRTSGEIILPVKLSYMDVNNNPFEETVEVPVKVYTPGEIRSFGITAERSNTWIIVALLIVAGAGYYIWKKKRAKR